MKIILFLILLPLSAYALPACNRQHIENCPKAVFCSSLPPQTECDGCYCFYESRANMLAQLCNYFKTCDASRLLKKLNKENKKCEDLVRAVEVEICKAEHFNQCFPWVSGECDAIRKNYK